MAILPEPHLLVDLGDGLHGDGPGFLAALVEYLLDVAGPGLYLIAPGPQFLEVIVDAVGQVTLAVNTATLSGGAFTVDGGGGFGAAEDLVQRVDIADLGAPRYIPAHSLRVGESR